MFCSPSTFPSCQAKPSPSRESLHAPINETACLTLLIVRIVPKNPDFPEVTNIPVVLVRQVGKPGEDVEARSVSIHDGPPPLKRWMRCFALAGRQRTLCKMANRRSRRLTSRGGKKRQIEVRAVHTRQDDATRIIPAAVNPGKQFSHSKCRRSSVISPPAIDAPYVPPQILSRRTSRRRRHEPE